MKLDEGMDEGFGSAVISSYTLSGSVPDDASVEVNIYKYNGTQFEILTGEEYDNFIS